MSADIRAHLFQLFSQALAKIAPEQLPGIIEFERPKQASHGDYATNVAMQLARTLKAPPRKVAESLLAVLPVSEWVEAVEIAGPGFLNIRLKAAAKLETIRRIYAAGNDYGRTPKRRREKVVVEFVSANPTGPLHVGHGRQAALGDAICALLETQGYAVTREFYYNDAGVQIQNLAISVRARAKEILGEHVEFPEDGYRGEYIREIAQAYLEEVGHDLSDIERIRKFAVAALRKEQDIDLQAFGVKFDNYYLESSLYTDGRVEDTVKRLLASGKTFDADGALWLKTTDYGDDKDRVMRKSDGGYTYFVPDVAYHITKWERGYAKAINIQGSDHHSTIVRVRAGLQALNIGIPAGYPDYVLHKMVTVMRGSEEVKISKRAGSYVTVRDLIDEVGRDAVRFFLVSRKSDTEFVFDIDLAKSQSEENPVYYVQYAHARVCRVLEQWKQQGGSGDAESLENANLSPLTSERELALLTKLADFPDMLELAAREFSPHQIAFYLRDLAGEFHSYYNAERILVEDEALKRARLALIVAARQVLRNGLALLGVSAPEKM
ncbi:MAG TPA: arginine--tRNA ligase [Burkholderiales bacterium]|nr:arginine--tRNA ligase [Burkholderiales bacterium]